MSITFDIEDNVHLPDNVDLKRIKRWIGEIIKNNKKKAGDIGYLFCSDEKILEINNQYLKHDYYTDIITFDYCEEDIIAGDMFISIDTVMSNAKDFGVEVKEELLRVIIHGVLHLCGFSDKTEEEQALMRAQENLALSIYNNDEIK